MYGDDILRWLLAVLVALLFVVFGVAYYHGTPEQRIELLEALADGLSSAADAMGDMDIDIGDD